MLLFLTAILLRSHVLTTNSFLIIPTPLSPLAHAQKVDISGGIFSAVTGIRRIGDLAATKPHSFTSLKKRTFSETGKLGSTVAAQQFVFGAADEGSRMDSNSGFGSRSASVQGVKRPAGSAFQIPGGSLFAQLGAKRGRT